MNINGTFNSQSVGEVFEEIRRKMNSQLNKGITILSKWEFGTPFELDKSEKEYNLSNESQITELFQEVFHPDYSFEVTSSDNVINIKAVGFGHSFHAKEEVSIRFSA